MSASCVIVHITHHFTKYTVNCIMQLWAINERLNGGPARGTRSPCLSTCVPRNRSWRPTDKSDHRALLRMKHRRSASSPGPPTIAVGSRGRPHSRHDTHSSPLSCKAQPRARRPAPDIVNDETRHESWGAHTHPRRPQTGRTSRPPVSDFRFPLQVRARQALARSAHRTAALSPSSVSCAWLIACRCPTPEFSPRPGCPTSD